MLDTIVGTLLPLVVTFLLGFVAAWADFGPTDAPILNPGVLGVLGVRGSSGSDRFRIFSTGSSGSDRFAVLGSERFRICSKRLRGVKGFAGSSPVSGSR